MSANNHATEQRIYGGLMTVLEACGFQVLRDPTGNHHLVKGTLESAAAFYKLTVAGADAAQRPAPVAGQEPAPRTVLAMVLQWEEFQRISDIPAVHQALQDFSDDPNGDNGVYIVREVLRAIAPTPVASAQPNAHEVASASALTYPATLTADLAEIMGMANFRCAPIARVYREAGLADVARKAEAEQAFVIDKLVRFVIAHGADWRKHAQEELNQARAAYVAKKTAPAPMTQERFNEKMDALDAANPAPLERLVATQGGKGSTP